MKLFVANFETIDKETKVWVYESIKVPFLSVFINLKLDSKF